MSNNFIFKIDDYTFHASSKSGVVQVYCEQINSPTLKTQCDGRNKEFVAKMLARELISAHIRKT
jgi:hypothetical protein